MNPKNVDLRFNAGALINELEYNYLCRTEESVFAPSSLLHVYQQLLCFNISLIVMMVLIKLIIV